jgi:DNA invertase Pin-like site-specific DNA recombinase
VIQVAYSYIRFSSARQADGDSLRRQTDLAAEYAAKHGLHLDEELTFQDLGISAFRGTNKTEGALAAFIQACKSGRVKPGSVLLVESLDRLSREQIRKPLRLLLEMIDDYKIEVHTLSDGKIYGQGSDFQDLVISLAIMSRANEESERKSQRVGAAWKNKKTLAASNGGVAITAKVPLWIRAIKGKPMELIPERAAIVRRIFKLALDGLGANLISQELNKKGDSFSGKNKGWHKSYVEKILRHPATYGAFQPYRRLADGRREKDGDSVQGYFPAVIDYATFQAVQEARQSRYRKRKGRSDAKMRNLFAGLVVDADLGLPMVFYWRGNELVTDSYRFKKKPNRINYAQFESAFLHFLDALDWRSLVGKESKEIATIRAELSKALLERENSNKLIARLEKLLVGDDEPPKTLIARLKEAETREEVISATTTRLQREIDLKRSEQRSIADPHELRLAIEQSDDIEMRFRLREQIRKRIAKIEIWFRGPAIIADIVFINGTIRQIEFLDREGDYKTIDAAEVIKMTSKPVHKRMIVPISMRKRRSRR